MRASVAVGILGLVEQVEDAAIVKVLVHDP